MAPSQGRGGGGAAEAAPMAGHDGRGRGAHSTRPAPEDPAQEGRAERHQPGPTGRGGRRARSEPRPATAATASHPCRPAGPGSLLLAVPLFGQPGLELALGVCAS